MSFYKHEQSTFMFSRKTPWFRFFFLLVLAIVLFRLDSHVARFHRWRMKWSVVVVPLQYMVDAPIQSVHVLLSAMRSQQQLLTENTRLRAKELLLNAKLQTLLALEKENASLRELLQSSSHLSGKVVIARLLSVSLDPGAREVVINKGKRDHVYLGQPVLDAYGVLGQVVTVGPLTSTVLLITDSHSAVPVQDLQNGIRAIAVGVGDDSKLAIIDVPGTVEMKEGDLLVTSGLGLHYPVGYPVAVISVYKREIGHRFATITSIPAAHLDRSTQVLLVWPKR